MTFFIESIALPMAEIFNSMIRSGIFPDDLRIAKVIPLYKSGDSSLFIQTTGPSHYYLHSPKCLKD